MQDRCEVSQGPLVGHYSKKATGVKIRRLELKSCYLPATVLTKVPSPMTCNLLFPTVPSLDRYWLRANQGGEATCASLAVKSIACCKKHKGTVLE